MHGKTNAVAIRDYDELNKYLCKISYKNLKWNMNA